MNSHICLTNSCAPWSFLIPTFACRANIFAYPELQQTPKTHPVATPRFNLAFVKLVNFDEIATYYDKHEKAVKSP